MKLKKRVALYYRVSTADQSITMQQADLRRYAKVRGLMLYKEYSDEGVSGTKAKRPALDRLVMGKAMFTIVAAIAELEHSIIKERVTAGVRQAITKRKSWGRRPIETVDPTISTTVIRLKKQGLGCHRIGHKLGLSSRTVWKVLQRQHAA